MKEIKAVIQPGKLYTVLTALRDIPSMPGFIVTDARAFPRGHPNARSESHGIDALDSFDAVKLECVVDDSLAQLVVKTIVDAAHTGNPGDGRVVVAEIEQIVVIRTGRRSEDES